MPARLFLPALWLLWLLLPVPRSLAQGRPLGPWRLTYQMVSKHSDWGDCEQVKASKKVLKPVLTAAKWDAIPASIRLFLNCENSLIAPARPRKGQLPLHFTSAGATVRLDTLNQQLMMIIVPSAPVVTLWAHQGKTRVFKHVFKCISPPLPHIECWVGGGRASSSRHPERFSAALRAIPQPEFASFMPDDAKYRVSQYQLTLLRNNVPLGPTKVIGGLKLTNEVPLDSAQSGDKLQVDVQQVQRQNFRGVIEDIPYIKHFVVELL